MFIRRPNLGDGWDGEPPLYEDVESYRLSLYQDDVRVRQFNLTTSEFVYENAQIMADFPLGLNSRSKLGVAQISVSYGPGPELFIALDA